MKKIFISIFLFLQACIIVNAQNEVGKSDDFGRISLSPILGENMDDFPEPAKQLLLTKLLQIATQNGLGGGNTQPRFIITSKVNVISKDIVPGPPALVVQNLEVSFFIADYIDQKVYSSVVINLKGVGTNETKAFIEAIKNIKPQSQDLKNFVEIGKLKIVEYYNSECDFILMKIQSLASQKKYEEAIYNLASVPEICKDCYAKSMDAMGGLYQKHVDYLCDQNMAKANSAWLIGMDLSAAKDASVYLSQIYPDSKCYNEAQKLNSEIKIRLNELYKFELKKYEDNLMLEQKKVQIYKEISLSYIDHLKPLVYNLGFIFH